jgi:Uma2 family endonuclease
MTVLHPVPPFALEAAPASRQTLAEYFQHLSEDEFYAFCQQNREQKFERRVDGTIEFATLTGGTTGRLNSEIVTDLTIWNRQSRLGFVFDSSTGFRLPTGAVRSPDVSWVRTEAWQALTAEQQQKFPPLCPDFVVELVSPSDVLTDVVVKMEEYIANGYLLAWLIDPKTETARAFRADGSVSVANTFAETLSGEDVLPGFTLALSTIK